MQLMTKALERRCVRVGSQADVRDPLIVAKFLNPTGAGTGALSAFDVADPLHPQLLTDQAVDGTWVVLGDPAELGEGRHSVFRANSISERVSIRRPRDPWTTAAEGMR